MFDEVAEGNFEIIFNHIIGISDSTFADGKIFSLPYPTTYKTMQYNSTCMPVCKAFAIRVLEKEMQ